MSVLAKIGVISRRSNKWEDDEQVSCGRFIMMIITAMPHGMCIDGDSAYFDFLSLYIYIYIYVYIVDSVFRCSYFISL